MYILKNKELIDKIQNIKLSKIEEKIIAEKVDLLSKKQLQNYRNKNTDFDAYNTFKNIYIMYCKFMMSANEISIVYGKTRKSISTLISNLGWTRTSEERQKLASKKRDYNKIKIKSRKTRVKNVCLSNSEEYIRQMLYIELKRFYENSEVIVGINSTSYLNSYELDIPIVVIHNGTLFKFALEINGAYYHRDPKIKLRDTIKSQFFTEQNYYYIEQILTDSTSNYLNSIVYNISQEIKLYIENLSIVNEQLTFDF